MPAKRSAANFGPRRRCWFFLALVLTLGCDARRPEKVASGGVGAASPGIVTVEFIVDRPPGDSVPEGSVSEGAGEGEQVWQRVTVSNVVPGSTVESVMRRIDSPAVAISGSGVTAFVSQVGDRATSGGRGWTFRVDGKFVPVGIGVAKMTPPATVSWRYGDWDSIENE